MARLSHMSGKVKAGRLPAFACDCRILRLSEETANTFISEYLLTHYTQHNIVKVYHSVSSCKLSTLCWSLQTTYLCRSNRLFHCVQRTKPVRSERERHKLVACLALLHVMPKAEEKWVNILSCDYKCVVFAVCKELGGSREDSLRIFLDILPTKAGIPSHYTNLEMFTSRM